MSPFISGPGLIFLTSVLPTTLILFLQVYFLFLVPFLHAQLSFFLWGTSQTKASEGDIMDSVAVRTGILMLMENVMHMHRGHKTR